MSAQEKDKPVAVRVAEKDALPIPDDKASDWIPLFNGKDLGNWKQRNGWAQYRIEGENIVGFTAVGSPNSFLCTQEDYSDFELRFEVKVDDGLNSGVHFRSKSLPNTTKVASMARRWKSLQGQGHPVSSMAKRLAEVG